MSQRKKKKKIHVGPKLKNGDKNWNVKCQNCDATPTVHPTALCGPCCFGEADTAGGNW